MSLSFKARTYFFCLSDLGITDLFGVLIIYSIFSFDLLLNRFKHKVEAGEILLDYFNDQNPEYFSTTLPKYKKYNFVSSEGVLDFKWISLDYYYQFNDSPLTFINSYFSFIIY